MKTIVKTVAFLCVFLVCSCLDNDSREDNWTCTLPSPMSGKWNLTRAYLGLAGEINVEKGKCVWYIDFSKKEIKVENSTEGKGIMEIKTGIYKFNLEEGVITVFKAYETDKDYQGDWFLKKGKLCITNNPEVDGSAYMFERD